MKQLFTFLLLAFIYVGVSVGVQASDVTAEKPTIEFNSDYADLFSAEFKAVKDVTFAQPPFAHEIILETNPLEEITIADQTIDNWQLRDPILNDNTKSLETIKHKVKSRALCYLDGYSSNRFPVSKLSLLHDQYLT